MPKKDAPTEELPKFTPSPFQRKVAWTALTWFCIVVIGSIVVGGILLVSWGLGYLQPLLVPLAVAAILTYLLDPVVRWLIRKGFRRRKAVLTVFGSFVALIAILAFMVIYPSVRQAKEFRSEYLTVQDDIAADAEGRYGEKAPWISKTKLGAKGSDLLDQLDRKLGDLAFVEQFKVQDESSEAQGKWDIGEISNWLWSHVSGFLDEVALFFGRGFSSAAAMLGYLVGFVLVPIYLYFFLSESAMIARRWSDYVPLWESDLKNEIVEVTQEINQYLIAYFRGQMLVSIIDAALVTVALWAIGLPYALLLGVFLAILGLIPFLGNLLVMIPAALIAIVHFGAKEPITAAQAAVDTSGKVVKSVDALGVESFQIYTHTWDWLPNQIWAYVLIVIGLFVILQQINGWVTAPKIVGESVGLHPVTVIFSIFFWSMLLGGLLGALMAVPLTASVKVLFRRYIWEQRVKERLAVLPKKDDNEGETDDSPEDKEN